jgi:predicted RNase H-like HicB family nuclease
MTRQYFSVVWKEGQYFVARCLNVEVSSFGESHEDALKNLQEALELYLEDALPQDIPSISQASISIQQVDGA